MVNNKELTKLIIKANNTPASEVILNKLVELVVKMHCSDDWIMVASSQNDKGELAINSVKIKGVPYEGNYVVVYSENKYFNKKFGSSIMEISTRNLIDLLSENLNISAYCGIVINPESQDAELVLSYKFFYKVFAELGL